MFCSTPHCREALSLRSCERRRMDTLSALVQGVLVAASPLNLLYGFAGVLLGTMVGVLPGLGPAGAIALLLPLALHAPPLAYLIMLFGITYGAQYGGSTTSIRSEEHTSELQSPTNLVC